LHQLRIQEAPTNAVTNPIVVDICWISQVEGTGGGVVSPRAARYDVDIGGFEATVGEGDSPHTIPTTWQGDDM
jgi:hypothetical protein